MSAEPWDDQEEIDPDVAAFGLFMERLAQAVETAGAQVAEALLWNAHATNPEKVPCPHTMKHHREGKWQ